MTETDTDGAAAGKGYGATLWVPDAQTVRNARISHYLGWLAQRGAGLDTAWSADADPMDPEHAPAAYRRLWQWSVDNPGEFWTSIWDYFEVLGDRPQAGPALTGTTMPDVHWFPGATLNYARNALRTAASNPDQAAIIYSSERGRDGSLSYRELADEVGRVAAGLRGLGVGKGDRVVALLPNIPEAVIGLLAAASIGAIWSSCSPDFGIRSVVDRWSQIEPAVLIAVDGYAYNGKQYPRSDVVADIAAQLPSLRAVVMVGLLGPAAENPAAENPAEASPPALPRGVALVDWRGFGEAAEPEFAELPFEHPLWVVYSSGTTGLPKPIVHGQGGIVLEHLKSLAFHLNLGPGDRFSWYTTTGWMMWNFQVGGLLAGTTIVLYDGAAAYPAADRLWRLAADTGLSYLGVGAPYLMAGLKAGLVPREDCDLTSLRGIGSTGSPLPPEGFDWVYRQVKPDVQLGSLSGGTDVCTGFVGHAPLLPIRTGIISGPALGAKVEAFDDHGKPVIGEVGELVITEPMPSMPVFFWNDPDGTRYRESYFADYPGVWRHGDWIEMRADGSCVIYGRSDATLNRGGVRMGTSEFYRVVEAFPEVADSLVVDTGRLGADGRLILFVQLAQGQELTDELAGRIKSALRQQLSPRHVPDELHVVPGVPRTLSGKKLEVPVRKILLGTPVERAADPSALANPDVLASYIPGPRL
ncbi:acetoacetate--CoA ligase [Trebonia kvetii]|uniref:Acetoacetate--CoA ligase n=1 Tax=Trebonia kvetii TaxID=2480626 RepID=A0A6P2C6Z4_9ACTN|nr:acetoacetate--CoA ligase [Trebonia kvetii]TVZ07068.1 acetoacetate--CoA ligase [Trebonia kvetii]